MNTKLNLFSRKTTTTAPITKTTIDQRRNEFAARQAAYQAWAKSTKVQDVEVIIDGTSYGRFADLITWDQVHKDHPVIIINEKANGDEVWAHEPKAARTALIDALAYRVYGGKLAIGHHERDFDHGLATAFNVLTRKVGDENDGRYCRYKWVANSFVDNTPYFGGNKENRAKAAAWLAKHRELDVILWSIISGQKLMIPLWEVKSGEAWQRTIRERLALTVAEAIEKKAFDIELAQTARELRSKGADTEYAGEAILIGSVDITQMTEPITLNVINPTKTLPYRPTIDPQDDADRKFVKSLLANEALTVTIL